MQDLQEVTHDLHYENYRASRLGDEPEQPVQPAKPEVQNDQVVAVQRQKKTESCKRKN